MSKTLLSGIYALVSILVQLPAQATRPVSGPTADQAYRSTTAQASRATAAQRSSVARIQDQINGAQRN